MLTSFGLLLEWRGLERQAERICFQCRQSCWRQILCHQHSYHYIHIYGRPLICLHEYHKKFKRQHFTLEVREQYRSISSKHILGAISLLFKAVLLLVVTEQCSCFHAAKDSRLTWMGGSAVMSFPSSLGICVMGS